MHLARTVEHTTDVDGMLECMTPEQFDEWHRLYLDEPWGDDWQQAGTIAAAFHNEILGALQSIQTAAGDKPEKLKEKDFDKPEDYIPRVRKKQKRKTKITSTQEMLVMARMMAGV